MPPSKKYSKQQILDMSIKIVRENGPEALNARFLAKSLGCSTQPIFKEFSGMSEIKHEILLYANSLYNRYIENTKGVDVEKPYKATGIAYIKFAIEEKELFKLLFMRDRSDELSLRLIDDDNIDYILNLISEATGLSKEKAIKLHFHSWIHVHGIAVMAATNYLNFTENEINELLSEEFIALREKFKNE